ncbi:hypothetical protein POM88_003600 [Heracleum sosnowskyi]|uniref:Uncharacterized protein n=1 Tax=Heracleum sosnowskyi TaxID=360622 RepID=A0AAD8N704_9APIA|nr:hypothetical protein POM88_003600 [Heracleum sosnowskyi]
MKCSGFRIPLLTSSRRSKVGCVMSCNSVSRDMHSFVIVLLSGCQANETSADVFDSGGEKKAYGAFSDTQSSRYQSSRSVSLLLTQSTLQALGTAQLSGIGIFDVQTKEESGGKVEEIINASLGATQTDTFFVIFEIQNLKSRKVSARFNTEKSSATGSSGETSNLASLTLVADQAPYALSVASPFERKCGEKLEEVPQVNKSESPKIDVSVQDVTDTDKFTKESVKGKDAIQHVSEKSINTKGSMAHITRKALSYVECNFMEADDAMWFSLKQGAIWIIMGTCYHL